LLPPPQRPPRACPTCHAAHQALSTNARRSRHPEVLREPRVSSLPLLQLGALGIDLLDGAMLQPDSIRAEGRAKVGDGPVVIAVVVAGLALVPTPEDQHRPVIALLHHP